MKISEYKTNAISSDFIVKWGLPALSITEIKIYFY